MRRLVVEVWLLGGEEVRRGFEFEIEIEIGFPFRCKCVFEFEREEEPDWQRVQLQLEDWFVLSLLPLCEELNGE